MTVSSVTTAGRQATFTHADDRLPIPLPPAQAGEELQGGRFAVEDGVMMLEV